MAHEFETKLQAQDLYVLEGATLEEVSEKLALPIQTVKRWSADEGWVGMRKEYREAQSEIRRKTTLYRLELLKAGIQTLHPQAAYAWAAVEQAAKKSAEAYDSAQGLVQREQSAEREIKTVEDAISAMQEAVQRRINLLLSDPKAVSLKSMRELKDALAMIEEMRKRHGVAKEGSKLLDAEAIKKIREQYL